MIEILITPQMIASAEQRINRVSFNSNIPLNKFGSEKDRTFFGFLGEELVKSVLNVSHNFTHTQYDLSYNGKKVEVKTISCSSMPKPHYLCTVNSHDLNKVYKQDADYYIFCRILNDKSKGWVLGIISCVDFFTSGTFIKKGESVFPGVKFEKANATVIEISKLKNFQLSIF